MEGGSMTVAESAPATERSADALVGRLFGASLGMMEVMSVYVGDRLGLYRALHDQGHATPGELAARVGVNARYAREWLEQQAVADLLDVDDASAAAAERRYALPDAYVGPLLDPDNPLSIAPMCRSIVALAKAMPQLLTAYRTGRGVGRDAYG